MDKLNNIKGLITTLTLIFSVFFSVYSQSVTRTVSWDGALAAGGCSGQNQGCGDWACSNNFGNWNGGNKNFTDPVPAGNTITSISVRIFYVGCGATSATVNLNSNIIGTVLPVNSCGCNGGCDNSTLVQSGPFSAYNYGGTNTLNIQAPSFTGSSFCVNYAEITFNYQPSVVVGPCPNDNVLVSGASTATPQCGVFNDIAMGSGTYINVNVIDGAEYTFSTCLTSPSFDTRITAYEGGTTNLKFFNDDNGPECGGQRASANWTSDFTGVLRVNVDNPTCVYSPSLGSAILQYRQNNNVSLNLSSIQDLCAGDTRTLTAVPSGGTFSISPAGGGSISGNVFTASNNTGVYTLTYTLGDCSASQNINVVSPSTDPSSIIASPNSAICPGQTVDLTVNGGSLGTGSDWVWYAGGSCGGSVFQNSGNASTITVSPTSTTTYSVRGEGPCGNTVCVTRTVTVNTESTAPTNAAANPSSAVCPGDAVVLTASGGSLGTGGNYRWYTGSCGGAFVATGNPITVNPTAASTTYYVRAEDNCGQTSCASVTVNTQATSTAPTGINFTNNNFCPGGSTTLTVQGGSLGTGDQWVWYDGNSCCGLSIASGVSSINVSPTSTENYFVRAEGSCGFTSDASTTITVKEESVAPTSISASSTQVCGTASNSVTLSVNGGSLGTGANWFWYTGSCGGSSVGNGTSITVSNLTSTTTYFVRAEGDCNNTACANQVITVSNGVNITSSNFSNPSCHGASDGTASVTVSGGITPYTYTWSNGAPNNPTATGLSSGSYTVTVTDDAGCSSTQSFNLVDPQVLSVSNVATTDLACNGVSTGAITVTATGGTAPLQYSIDGGSSYQGSGSFSALAAGSYNIQVLDDNNCLTVFSGNPVVLSQPTAIVLTIDSFEDASCTGANNGEIFSSATGGTPPYSFSLNNGPFQPSGNFASLTAGTYTVLVRDGNGCTETQTQVISNQTALVVYEVSTTDATCFGANDGSATFASLNGTNPINYTINNITFQTNPTFNNLSAGTYTVLASDALGCSNDTTFTIGEPAEIVITIDSVENIGCNGATSGEIYITASGGSGGYSYNWSDSSTDEDRTGLAAGTYAVTVTDANNCTSTTTVTLNQAPQLFLSLADIDTIDCNGIASGGIDISVNGGTPPYSYNWSNGKSSEDISNLEPGTYGVTVEDDNGCQLTGSWTLTQPAAISFTGSVTDDADCNGGETGSIDLAVNGGVLPYTYQWSNGDTTQDIDSLVAGTYIVTVTDAKGCEKSETFRIFDPAFFDVFTFTDDVSCFGGNDGQIFVDVFFGPGFDYEFAWSTGFVDTSIFTSSISGLSAGTYTVSITDINNGCSAFETIVVEEPDSIVLTYTSQDASCDGSVPGEINLSVSGGTSPYTYAWSNSATTQDINGLTAGSYTVTLTDDNGCTATTVATISNTDAPNVIATVTDASCNGASDGSISTFTSGGISPYTYNWNNGATTQNINGLAAGTYVVTVTGANGCSSVESYVVGEPTPIAISLDNLTNANCALNQTGSIDISVSGGTGPYTYLWTNFETTQDLSNLTAGVYTVIATDANGCEASDVYTITDPAGLTSTFDITDVSCFGGSDGSITTNVTGGTGPYTYAWSNGATTANVSGLAPGLYSFTATDDNGCEYTVGGFVDEPDDIMISGVVTDANCAGTTTGDIDISVTGGTSPYTYAWSANAGSATTEDVSGLLAGTYTVTVTDDNGCTQATSFNVSQVDSIELLANITNVQCFGDSNGSILTTVVKGQPPYSFNWSNGATTQSLTGLSAGSYTVTMTDANSCIIIETFTVTEPTQILVSLDSINNADCTLGIQGDIFISVSGGSAPYTYLWANGETTQDINNLSAGTYVVQVTDANGCEVNASYTVTDPVNISHTATVNDVSCFGSADGSITINVTGGATPYDYLWTNGATGTNSISSLDEGLYGVTVTDDNGCEYFASFVIEEFDSISLSSIYGNVDCYGNANGFIDLVVSGGKSPLSYNWNNGAVTQDLNGLGAGVYKVTVTDDNGCADSLTVSISEPDSISLSESVNNVSCNGGSDGAIFLTVNGGTSPVSFDWSNGATSGSITNLSAGSYDVTVTDANGCIQTNSYSVTEPTAIVVNVDSIADADCQNGVTGSVFISVTGGTAPYSYVWNNGDFTQDITGLSKGNYSVVVEDANGCTATASAFVDDPFGITASTVITDASCYGASDGEIDLTVSGGTGTYTYLWTTGDTTEDLTGLTAGNYGVTVSDVNGCDLFVGVTVDQPDSIALTTSVDDANCAGTTTGSITLTVSGGTSPYSYLWSTSATTKDISGLLAGTYTVTVTDDNGCTAVISDNVSQVDSMELLANVEDVSCFNGSDGRIFTTVKYGASPYVYSWSTGDVTGDITGISAGTYTVTMTDAVGCILIETYTVGQPTKLTSSIAGTDASCNGQASGNVDLTVSGGTSPYSYLWNSFDSTQDLTNVGAGLYTVVVEDANGCTTTNSVTIGEPNAISVADSIVNVTCFGDNDGAVYLTVSGGTPPLTFAWSNGASTQNLVSVVAGTYDVTITDNNGCADTLSYTIAEPDEILVSSTSTDASCFGSSDGLIDVTVSGGMMPYDFDWNTGDTTEDLSGLSAGIYDFTVTDNNGCSIVHSDTIDEPSQIVVTDTIITDVSCSGGFDGAIDITVAGGTTPYDYEWSIGLISQDVNGLFAGTYSVTITDANGCELIESYTISEPQPLSTSFSGSNNVFCFGDSSGNVLLTVNGGTSPYTYDWSNGATTQNLNNVPAGLYSVVVEDANGCTLTASYSVTQPPLLSVSGAITNVTCYGGIDGEIDLTVSGGVPSYSYDWSTSDVTQDVTGLTAGTFTVIVFDANTCSDTSSYVVTQPDSFDVSAQVIDVDCYGNATGGIDIAVTGSNPPYSYAWNNGPTTQDVFGLLAGTYTLTITDVDGCEDISTYNVDEPDSLDTEITSVNLACNGTPTGSVDLTVSGGTPPYRYNWSNGSTSQDLSNIQAGFYSVTVTDFNGCTKFDSVTVTQPDPLNASVNVTSVLCNGDSTGAIVLTPLGGTPPYSYNWSNGETTKDISNLPAGLYTVTITDDSSCTVSLTYNVSEPPVLDFDYTQTNVLCYGQNGGNINVLPTGGVQPYSYNWSNGDTTGFINRLLAGDYYLTLTDDNGCVKLDTFTITQPDSISTSVTTVDALCNGSFDGSVDLTVSGGVAPYEYLWNGFNFTQDLNGLQAGRYVVIVTDSNGCTAVDSAFVGQPSSLEIEVFVKGAGCGSATGGIIDLTVSGGTPTSNNPPYDYFYLWSTGDTTEDLTSLAAGTYTVTVTDSNGCEEVRSILIPSFPQPVPGFTADNVCFENAVQFNNTSVINSGTMDFIWDYGDGTVDSLVESPVHVYAVPDTYVVTLTTVSNQGCVATFTDSVIVYPLPDATITGTGGNPCVVDSVELSVAEGYVSYRWSTGDTVTTINVLESGVYGVTVENIYGCTSVDTIPVFISDVNTVTVSEDTTINFGFGAELFANGGEEYVWSPAATIDNPFSSDPIVTPEVSTTYSVIVSDENGCTFSDTVRVTVDNEILLIIPNIITPNGDGFNETWEIKNILNYDICQVNIFNRWGNEVYSQSGYQNDWDGGNLPDGTYYYVIQCDNSDVLYKGALTILR